MLKHTPTPWILGKAVMDPDGQETRNIDTGPRWEGGLYIANAYTVDDAAFIVRAVNVYKAHEETLDGLRLAVEQLKAAKRPVKVFERIIAKAEGKI